MLRAKPTLGVRLGVPPHQILGCIPNKCRRVCSARVSINSHSSAVGGCGNFIIDPLRFIIRKDPYACHIGNAPCLLGNLVDTLRPASKAGATETPDLGAGKRWY